MAWRARIDLPPEPQGPAVGGVPGPTSLAALPGTIVNLALEPIHLAAQLTAGGMQAVGGAIGNHDLVTAGQNVVLGDSAVIAALQERPLEATELAVGGALVVTGVATAPGLALVGAGVKGLAQQVAANGGLPPVIGAAPPAPVPALAAPPGAATDVTRRAPHGLARLLAWLRSRLFGRA